MMEPDTCSNVAEADTGLIARAREREHFVGQIEKKVEKRKKSRNWLLLIATLLTRALNTCIAAHHNCKIQQRLLLQ